MKIVLLPLDERPCNSAYPSLMPMHEDIELLVTPKEYLSNQKIPCDLPKLDNWLFENTKDADYLIISLDTFLFGGIIPSRLHHTSLESLIERSNLLKKFKERNPKLRILANELIMRCPSYSLSVEEPSYFDECGEEIWWCGYFKDKAMQGLMTKEDEIKLAEKRAKVKDEYLEDLVSRRQKNLNVIKHNLLLLKEGYIDFLSIPQDDCAEFGFTSIDRREVEKFIKENNISNVMGYPGADEVGMDLLSKTLNEHFNNSPKVYLWYADKEGMSKVPEFEDRALDITVNLHLKVAGCTVVDDYNDAEIVYIVDSANSFVATNDPRKPDTLKTRDIDGLVDLVKKAKKDGKIVAIADIAYTNEGDPVLFKRLVEENLLQSIDSYSGWNTNSNTLGTTTCEAICRLYSDDEVVKNKFLCARYMEDVFYMSYARRELIKIITDANLKINSLDDKKDEYAEFVKERILSLSEEFNLKSLYDYKDIKVSFPWNRTFEICLEVE